MKRLCFILLPTLVLGLLVALGYWAGAFVRTQGMARVIHFHEQGESLAGVLAITPLSELQRTGYVQAYSDPAIQPEGISWGPPNQPTPFVGTAPQPGQHRNAHINDWQMRSAQALSLPKPAGVRRIFLTGGSTAYGSGAPSQELTIGALLQAELNTAASGEQPRYEVFTFANPGWVSTHERIAIENYLSELEPDLIVSLSGNNDVFWADAGRNVLWFATHSDEYVKSLVNEALKATGRQPKPALPHAEPAADKIPPEQVAARLAKNAVLGATALQHPPAQAGWLYVLQPNLAATRKPLTEREAAFITPSREYYASCYAAIATQLSGLQLPNFRFLNLSGVFDQLSQTEELFIDQFHFGDKGNRIIAQAMAPAVLQALSGLAGQ